ncbi:MAG: hypothetical protein FWE37_01010 [Spirochaetaceae bacterium]|nr:hypothetical protein [Spirochaetaceae bacterium]
MVAKFILKKDIKNIVFMGMGEPLDNFDNVIKAIDIFTHPYGPNIAASNITISSVGSVDNINKFANLIKMDIERAKTPPKDVVSPTAYRAIRFAVSLTASNNDIRSKLMPVNHKWNLQALKGALQELPLKRKSHNLFIEYILIAGLTASTDNARELAAYLSDLPSVVNLINYNPLANSPYRPASRDEQIDFVKNLTTDGQVCRWRDERGADIGAACGQLGAMYA